VQLTDLQLANCKNHWTKQLCQ